MRRNARLQRRHADVLGSTWQGRRWRRHSTAACGHRMAARNPFPWLLPCPARGRPSVPAPPCSNHLFSSNWHASRHPAGRRSTYWYQQTKKQDKTEQQHSPTWRRAWRQRSLLSRRPSWRWCSPGCACATPRSSIACSSPPEATPRPSDSLGEEPSTWLPSSSGASRSSEGAAGCAARRGVLAGVLPSPRSLSFSSRASLSRCLGSCIAAGSGLRLLRRPDGPGQ